MIDNIVLLHAFNITLIYIWGICQTLLSNGTYRNTFIQWRWWLPCKVLISTSGAVLGSVILPKDTSTCRLGESNRHPSNNKTQVLPLSHSWHESSYITQGYIIQITLDCTEFSQQPTELRLLRLISTYYFKFSQGRVKEIYSLTWLNLCLFESHTILTPMTHTTPALTFQKIISGKYKNYVENSTCHSPLALDDRWKHSPE